MTNSEPSHSRRPLRLQPLPHPGKTPSEHDDRRDARGGDDDDDEGAWIHEWSVPETGKIALDS